jgi:GntR family transcriptional regulator, vanillate catabolism transcriptional regulator
MPDLLADAVKGFRIDPRTRLVDQVTHALREMILQHKIPPGARLVQTELADRLGVSRTPLREAIRVLEQDGLVRISNGNNTVEVVSLTVGELLEMYEIREVIDGLAARLLARQGMSSEADRQISRSLQVMTRSIMPFKGEVFFTAHIDFHVAILSHCGNAHLLNELQLVRVTAASLRDLFPRTVHPGRRGMTEARQNAELTIAEHTAIYDAICRRDQDLAEEVARFHIRKSCDLISTDADDGRLPLPDPSTRDRS